MQIIRQLGSGEGLPKEAIQAATAERTTVAPLLLDAIERCEPSSDAEKKGLFIAFHLLGQWQDKSAYRALARFLRRPDVEMILGDATTETSHKVMASVFDGDPSPIFDIINDSGADEFVRNRMFGTLVILAFRGELDRTQVADFLRSSFNDLQPQDQSAVWEGWQGAVALLALKELEPLVSQAFRHGFVDKTIMRFKDFEDDLRRACAGHPLQSWQRREYEPFGDIVEELSDWPGFQPSQRRDQAADGRRLPSWPAEPAKNPLRNVGRNDPCPCGSSKKFKKCCLGKAELDEIAAVSDIPFDVDELLERDDAGGQITDYDPLVEPDPVDWLATDEQRRLDLVQRYHRNEGFDAKRAAAHAAMHVTVENQIAEGDQLPVLRTLLRLMAEGLDRHDAIHAIASVLIVHINELLRRADSETPPPGQRSGQDSFAAYFSELEQLTAEAWLRSG
jgi:hypothetical protein